MSYKLLSLLTVCLFSFVAPESAPKIIGKYGKIDRENGEYICLELFGDENFSMSISSCDKDRYIDGKYTFDGTAVYLTSTQQPAIEISEIDSEESAKGERILTFSSDDAPLIQKIKVRVNDNKKIYTPNTDSQIRVTENIKKINITLGDLEVTQQFSKVSQNHHIQLTFSHLNKMTMNKQKWNYTKKKLILTDDSGTQITLKKSRKCWFDYKFKE